ncbi:hypothetical protein MJ391_21815 [Escherichia coli]|nr:hypothetical protein MJ391_21815 [Escherichia coli]
MSHIRSRCRPSKPEMPPHTPSGLGQMNLHGYLAREGIAYGSPEALDFINLYFYTITWHALRTSMLLARERWKRFAEVPNGHAMPVVNISANICKGELAAENDESWRTLFARSGITLPLPVRCGRQLRDERDALRHL